MQFRDLKQQYQVLKKDIDAAMIEVATNCNFINGQQVKDLEKKLAEYVGVKHCITCGNGTDALTMAMMAWGFKEGDAVFVPDFTFFSSGEIVSHAGAAPVRRHDRRGERKDDRRDHNGRYVRCRPCRKAGQRRKARRTSCIHESSAKNDRSGAFAGSQCAYEQR